MRNSAYGEIKNHLGFFSTRGEGGHRALDTGQFRLWSKFKVPFSVQKWTL